MRRARTTGLGGVGLRTVLFAGVECLTRWLGPGISRNEMARGRLQFLVPTLLLGLAGLLLMISVFFPYWTLRVSLPEPPGTVELQVYLNHLEGETPHLGVQDAETGAPVLPSRQKLELSMSVALIVVVALLAVAEIYIHNQWAALLSLPAVVFPAVSFGDFSLWLSTVESVGATVPGGFDTTASWAPGWILAVLASILIVIGLYFHRRVYRPLVRG